MAVLGGASTVFSIAERLLFFGILSFQHQLCTKLETREICDSPMVRAKEKYASSPVSYLCSNDFKRIAQKRKFDGSIT